MAGSDIRVQKMQLTVLDKKIIFSQQEVMIEKQNISVQLFQIFRKYVKAGGS